MANAYNSAGGDISGKSTEAVSGNKMVSNENFKKEKSEDNIFEYFQESYSQLTTLTANDTKEKLESVNEKVKILLECMIQKLNYNIQKISKEDRLFMRFLGMKTFLQHIFAKFVDETEAVTLLENVYEDIKPYLANPEVAYSGFLVMNSLSTLIQKTNSLEKVNKILEECQSVYNTLKYSNKTNNYYSGKELFSSEKELVSNKEARLKYEKLVITNLLFLGSVYEKMGNHYKDILCYHTAFSRMLNKGLVSPYKWVDFTTRLACVFIDDNNFKDARHHLSAATHVHEILEAKNKLITDNSTKELLNNNAIHLALAWVRYCVLLFEKSKDEDRTKFIILYKNGYLFPNTALQDKQHINDRYENYILNERNIVFKNQRFMDTIGKELVDGDHDKLDEYHDIIREKNIGFGDVLQVIERQNKPEENKADKNMKTSQGKCENEVDKNIDATANTGCDNFKNLTKEKDNESMKNDSDHSSNNQFIQDETDEESGTKDDTTEREQKKISKDVNRKAESLSKDHVEKEEHSQSTSAEKKSDGTNLTFSSLGYLPIEHSVTKDMIENPEEARNLFKFAYGWSKQAQLFYPKTKDFYSHIHIMLNMVSLYRLCAYFQGRDNLEYRISLEQTRENLLEQLVAELAEVQPESHLHVRLYQEMALLNIDLAMLNMCNIYNIRADDTYKLCALAEIQSHINHTYIVGDMLEKSTEMTDTESNTQVPEENVPEDRNDA